MIKINIDSRHIADISDEEELKGVNCELNIIGSPNELKHELTALLKAIECKESIYGIWLDVLSDWAAKKGDQ